MSNTISLPDDRYFGPDAEQKETRLSALRGKVVLLNFNFAEGGCDETCNPDFSILAELQEKHKGDPVEVVSRQAVTIRFVSGAVMEIPEEREDLVKAVVRALASEAQPC